MKSFTHHLTLNIPSKMAFRNITPEVRDAVTKSGVREGIILVTDGDGITPPVASTSRPRMR
jgi:thiamine phosphate synthase YjbQ (UPF0047 family)